MWLMCPPDYFNISYEINPWMQGNIGQTHHVLAVQQWQKLYEIMAARTTVQLLPAIKGLPDMVFTANAGLVSKQIFIPARFKFPERQGEEPHFLAWFKQRNYQVLTVDDYFEGEGDALFQPDNQLLWLGHGIRSHKSVDMQLAKLLNLEVATLNLINPNFYHLDTCFVPLSNKRAIYYPGAFDDGSLQKLRHYFAPQLRYEVDDEDALNFACNAIIEGNTFICNNATAQLRQQLQQWGFEVLTIPMTEFMKAGGAAKCLALRLQ